MDASTPFLSAAFPSTTGKPPPARKDSREKFDRIVEAAGQLLVDHDPDDITISQISRASHINRTTIYNFFSNTYDIYMEVARRELVHAMSEIGAAIRQFDPQDAFALLDALVDSAKEFFNSYPAARKTLFSAGRYEMRLVEENFDILCASFYRNFQQQDWPVEPLSTEDPFRTVTLIQTALLSASVQRYGLITDLSAHQTKIASKAYLAAILQDMNEANSRV